MIVIIGLSAIAILAMVGLFIKAMRKPKETKER